MTDLYSLNKDMLIELICKIKEETINQYSIKELEEIIQNKRRNEKCELLKKCILKLKIFPHLKNLIEENESVIKNMDFLKRNNLEILDFLYGKRIFVKNYESEEEKENDYENEDIYDTISHFLISDEDEAHFSCWLNSSEKKYKFCSECGGVVIFIYNKYREEPVMYKNDKNCKFCVE